MAEALFDAGDIADRLVAAGTLDAAARDRARGLQAATGERLHVILTRLGLISEADMAAALARHLGLDLVGAAAFPATAVLADQVTPQFLRTARVLPLRLTGDGLALAMADPLDRYAIDAIELLAGRKVRPCVAVPAEIDRAIDRLHGGRPTAAAPALADVAVADIERLQDLASDAPVIRLINATIADAVAQRASDIHIEPFEASLRVRFRVDGVLRPMASPPVHLAAAMLSRIKIMAGLDIAERRLPQDGRIKANVAGREIDLRVATAPTLHGESVVLRILDQAQAPLDLAGLGFAADIEAGLIRLFDRPHGILLVTGPTGSGKTTTLYAGLQRLNRPAVKILTVEDPIEYQLPGVNQIQVRPVIGLGFPQILRSLLRHDPDILMIGEIRDTDTARIAVQAALTGHLVLSTLHTNDAAGAVTRLRDMGIEEFLLTASLNGVLAQRLVRTLCPHCREAYRPPAETLARAGLPTRIDRLWRAKGCEQCQGTGYRGRTSIGELLVVDEAVRQLILARADRGAIDQAARGAGMRTMLEDGFAKAVDGVTSAEEVLRVASAA